MSMRKKMAQLEALEYLQDGIAKDRAALTDSESTSGWEHVYGAVNHPGWGHYMEQAGKSGFDKDTAVKVLDLIQEMLTRLMDKHTAEVEKLFKEKNKT